jgi:predicted secreted protein
VSWTSILAIYFVLWWVVLFAVLPFGVRSQAEEGAVARGTDPGAPAVPALAAKLAWTTAVSAALFGAAYWLYVSRLLTLERLATLWGLLK